MSVLLIISLIILGFLLVMVEILIIPGVTVAGIGGLILIGGGIVSGYYYHPTATGNYIMLGSLGGALILFFLALKLKTWQRFGLKSEIDGQVRTLEEGKLKVGDEGETVSRLAPIGTAMFNEELFEVCSEGSYIDAHKGVKIIKITGNKIYVELK